MFLLCCNFFSFYDDEKVGISRGGTVAKRHESARDHITPGINVKGRVSYSAARVRLMNGRAWLSWQPCLVLYGLQDHRELFLDELDPCLLTRAPVA